MIETRKRRDALSLAAVLLLLLAAPALAAGTGVYGSGLFQLGDGEAPTGFAGTAQIAPRPDQPGPSWYDLFDDEGWPRDDYPLDESGAPLGNGIADFRDRFGGLWVAFTADNEDASTGFEPSALGSSEHLVVNGSVSPSQDLEDLLGYVVLDGDGDPMLYLSATRAASGTSVVELELNRDFVRVGTGGFGRNLPWSLSGERLAGDLRIVLQFQDAALAGATVSVWQGLGWEQVTAISEEGCNEAESFCALSNAQAVDAGPWPGHSSSTLAPSTLVQVGLSAVDLVGFASDYVTLRARTSQDIGFAYFSMEGR